MSECDVVSADSHVIEPPELWEEWLSKKFKDRAPKLVKDEDGGDAWLFDQGRPPEPLGLMTVTGYGYDKFKWTGWTYDGIEPGCDVGEDRLRQLDFDGVQAEVIYPPQRTMGYFMSGTEPDFHAAGLEAYRRWVKDDFCTAAAHLEVHARPRLGAVPADAAHHPGLEGGTGQLIKLAPELGKERAVLRAQQGARDGLRARALLKRLPPSMHRPYGMRWEHTRLVPDGRFPVTREIWRMALAGWTLWAIARELTSRGVSTPKGKAIWRSSSIGQMLRNRAYAGAI